MAKIVKDFGSFSRGLANKELEFIKAGGKVNYL
jgi:hypothetical protein